MVIKICKICGKEFNAKGRDLCCSPECSKINRKNTVRECDRRWYKNHRDEKLRRNKEWRDDNPDYGKEYRENHRDEIHERNKKWRENNPDYDKEYRENHRDEIREYKKEYYVNHYDKILKRAHIHNKNIISELCEQYSGDLEEILVNVPNKSWVEREAKMRVWFGESYCDGMIVKIESIPVCEVTGESSNLVIHHLYSFNTHPELGNDPANMVRIIKDIHDEFHNIYGRGNNTPEQWVEFLNKRG